MNLSRLTNKHVCLALIPDETQEKMLLWAEILSANGIDYCNLIVPCARHSENAWIGQPTFASGRVAQSQIDLHRHWTSKDTAVVLQSPYLEDYPDWFWAEKETNQNLRFIYTGYGIALSNWSAGHYRLPSFKLVDRLGATDILGFVGAFLHEPLKTRLIPDPQAKLLSNRITSRQPERSLLWAPHWSQNWFRNTRGFSRFTESLTPITHFLLRNPEKTLTFRPHPILKKAINCLATKANPDSEEERRTLDSIKNLEVQYVDFISLPNVKFSDSSLVQDILSHEKLITDGVSIIAYWGLTGKPMVVWRDSDSPSFNSLGRLLDPLLLKVKAQDELTLFMQQDSIKWQSKVSAAALQRLLRLVLVS
jgi:hypothetical protein